MIVSCEIIFRRSAWTSLSECVTPAIISAEMPAGHSRARTRRLSYGEARETVTVSAVRQAAPLWRVL